MNALGCVSKTNICRHVALLFLSVSYEAYIPLMFRAFRLFSSQYLIVDAMSISPVAPIPSVQIALANPIHPLSLSSPSKTKYEYNFKRDC